MTRLAWIGWPYFSPGLPADRFAVQRLPLGPAEVLTWADITRRFGGAPDLLVYADCSQPPPLLGLEDFPCPTVFCCIDSHIHGWYPAWAQAFDLCTVSLRDHLPRFLGRLGPEQLLWLPPRAEALPEADALVAEADKTFDLLFVGKVDPATTPGRVRFLEELGAVFPGLHTCRGNFRTLFPRARLVLNVAEGGDLNFRVFEALACGACLLTPAVGHGQEELFGDGEHLFAYPAGDVAATRAMAEILLADPVRRAAVARQGYEAVRKLHGPVQRGEAFAGWLAGQPLADLVSGRLARRDRLRREALRLLYLHWAEALADDPRAALYLDQVRSWPR
jgi:hypothetical protein